MERSDYRLLPLAAYGIARGVGNVLLKPLIDSLIVKVMPSQEDIDAHIKIVAEAINPLDNQT